MKIKPEHFEKLQTAINETLAVQNSNGELVKAYQTGQFHNADLCKDLQRRFCWDLLYGAGLTSWICSDLYAYLNDDHIYTALKAICPTVQSEQTAMKYFHAYQTEMYYAHNRNRCWWGHRTRDQNAEWERRLQLWFEAAGEQMP